jgi:hypothetical protein
MNVAPSKAAIETPIVERTVGAPPDPARYADAVPWPRLAAAHVDECRLDEPSLAVVRAKRPRTWSGAGVGRVLDDVELRDLVRAFERSIAEDTVKNAYLHHGLVHAWLLDAARSRSGADAFASINARIYAELFRTPASDPWLGLVPPAAFTGIRDDGLDEGAGVR